MPTVGYKLDQCVRTMTELSRSHRRRRKRRRTGRGRPLRILMIKRQTVPVVHPQVKARHRRDVGQTRRRSARPQEA
jgi:hypothetical protein